MPLPRIAEGKHSPDQQVCSDSVSNLVLHQVTQIKILEVYRSTVMTSKSQSAIYLIADKHCTILDDLQLIPHGDTLTEKGQSALTLQLI